MQVFDDLKSKISEDPSSFIVILGAGASIPGGLPSWSELKSTLCEAIPDIITDSDEADKALERVNSSPDLWTAFGRLKLILGSNLYQRVVIKALDTSNRTIPLLYKQLWQLNISGIINFNLDKFAINSYSDLKHETVDFATGNEPHKYMNFPMAYDKFVFYPHGIISDPHSWVFTNYERRDLYASRDLISLFSALFDSKNLLIIGFNAREWSFLKLIEDIGINNRINGFHNYYFCPSLDSDIQRELGEYGISVIPYSPATKNHEEINGYLETLLSFYSVDPFLPTVYKGRVYAESDIPSASECYKYGIDELRDILNGVIANIIPADVTPTDEQINNLEKFYNTYITQLHRAWLVDPRSPETNDIYGYKVTRFIGNGAFGSVFEADAPDGSRCALKVLLPDVKDKISYLSCFRRGIRSMNILKDKNISGMVKIHGSYEIPACIIMDLVNGVTLREAIDKKYITRLETKLIILEHIARIIHSAHQLEERILHRDLKPENVMIENCYSSLDFEDSNDIPVVKVLDFDLSWHRGATEKTVMFGAISQGFMAPEQVDTSVDKSLSRNTAVDVYSIGMLTYYVLTSNNPLPNESQFANFSERLNSAISHEYKSGWKCLSSYLSDTIINATKASQFERISLDTYIKNMQQAKEMYLNNTLPNTHPLVLVELKDRLDPSNEIEFTDFGRRVVINYVSLSKRITLSTSSNRSRIILTVSIERYINSSDRRDGISKYFSRAKEKAVSVVKPPYFTFKKGESTDYNVVVNMSGALPDILTLQYIDELSLNILEVRQQLDL